MIKIPETDAKTASLGSVVTPVNRKIRVPLHQQIYEDLRTKIIQKHWSAGDLFPTEIELMEKYKVSRATIRQVMDRLVGEELIFRQQGRGTFISEPTLEQGLTKIISFTEDMMRRGLKPETRVLEERIMPADEEVAQALKLSVGDSVAFIKRLRMANNEPLCIEESFLIYRLCPGIFEFDFSIEPLREVLHQKFNIRIARALQKIHAIVAGDDVSALLQVEPPAAVLFIERVSFNERDSPVEFLRLYFRGDRYSLHNELRD